MAQAEAPGQAPARAWRVAPRLDGWTRRALAPGGRPARRVLPALGPRPVWTTPLAPVPQPDPQPDSQTGLQPAPAVVATALEGRLIVTVRPAPGPGRTRELRLTLRSSSPLGDPRLNAQPVAWRAGPGGVRALAYAAPPPEGLTLSFAAPPHGRAELEVSALADGWPPGAAPPPKPVRLMAWGDSDTTLTTAPATLAW